MRRLVPLSLICTLLMAGVARSTTVIPPTFESLVSSANTIFVGEVMDVRAEWDATPQGRAIQGRRRLEGFRRRRHPARIPRRHHRRHDDGSGRHADLP